MKRDLTPEQLAQEVSVRLPLSVLISLGADVSARAPGPVTTIRISTLPSIGDDYQGGIFAGVTLHDDRPHALVLVGEEGEDLTWEQAKAFAIGQGGELPTRVDMLVLWKNLRDRFRKSGWYWTSEQHESDADCAWMQDFSYGYQGYDGKGYEGLARAVRRVSL